MSSSWAEAFRHAYSDVQPRGGGLSRSRLHPGSRTSARAFSIWIITALIWGAVLPAAQAWWTFLEHRGAPVASYYLGDDLAYVFNFAVNQDTGPMTVSYGVGTTSNGSGWTWRNAEWSHQSGGDRYWKSKANEHRFTSIGSWYYSGRFVWTANGYTEYASGDWAENRTSLSASSYFTVNALINPTIGTVSATANSITLNWTRWNSKNVMVVRSTDNAFFTPSGGTSYAVNYTTGNDTVIYNSSGTTVTDSSRAAGTTYYYKLFSVNNNYYSSGATTSGITVPPAPGTPTASSVTTTSFTASWSAANGAASYRLDVATDSGFTSMVSGYNNKTVAGTSDSITGLTPGRTYYVRVRAVNSAGTGTNSGTLTRATDCFGTPTIGAASSIGDDRFTANWSSVSGATSYRLDVSESATFSGGAPDDHIDENIQDWTNRGSYGTYTQSIDAGTVNMVQCIVQNGASANGVCSVGRVQMQAANGILELPALDTVGTISMNIVAGGAGRSVKLQRYVSGSWTDLTTWSGIGTTGATYTYDLNSSDSGIRLRLAAPSSALYVHDIHVEAYGSSSAYVDGYENLNVGLVTSYEVTDLDPDTTYYYRVRAVNDYCTSPNSGTEEATTLAALATEPTTQAHTITFSSVGSTSLTINWTSGNGANRLVAIDTLDFSAPPADGTSYSADTSIGGGDELDDGGWVVYIGSGSSVTVTGLSPQTLYYVKVYEFNGSGGLENYLTTTASGNPNSRRTLSTEPSAHGSLTATAASASSINLNWTAATGASGYIIVRRQGSAPTGSPTDGVQYTQGDSIGDGTVVFVNTSGGASSTTDSYGSMSAATTYHYKIFPYAYNGTPAHLTYNYKTDGTPGADSATTWTTPTVTTTSADPSDPSDPTQASATGNVTATGGATVSERGIVWNTTGTPTTSDNKVAHASGGTGSYTVTLTGLTLGQTIYYRAYAINAVGTSYGSTETFVADCFTTGPTVGSASSISASGFTANWSALGGATGYRLDVSTHPYFDNRVANPVFATGDATSWSLQTQMSVSDEDAYIGTHSVKAAVTATRSVSQTVSIPVADGSTAYEISYWYRFDVDTGNGIRIWSSWDNGGGSGDSLTPGSYNAKVSEWTQIVLVNTPAAGATSLNFEVRVYNGATAFLDGFSVRKVGGDADRFLSGFENRTVSGTSEGVSGLDPNATYYYRVRGVSANCDSPNSDTETVVTLANVPSAPTVTAVAASSLDVTVNANGNPAGTQFAIQKTGSDQYVQANGSLGASAVWRTAAEWDTIRVTGLGLGEEHCFRVKARNSANTDTGFGSTGCATTWDTPTLTSPTATSIGQTAATLGATITANGGSAITARGTVYNTTGSPVSQNALAEGGTAVSAFSHERTALPQGTRIYYAGYAANALGTSYSPEGSFFTEPGQASNVQFANIGFDAMRITWTAGANSDGAIVVVRAGSAVAATPTDGTLHSANAAFGSGANLGSSQFVVYRGSGTQVDVTGLSAETTYHVAVFAYKGTVANSGVDQGINYRQTSPATGNQATLSCASIVTPPDALYERGEGGSVSMTVVANNSGPNYAWRKRGAGWSGGTWTGSTGDSGGTFIGNNQSSIDTSGKAWGMWANTGTTEMRRDFGAMSVGDIFYIEMDNNSIASGRSVGFGLQNSSGQNMVEFYFFGGGSNYRHNHSGGATDTTVPYTTAGLEITITVTSSTTYSMSVTIKGGSTYGPFTGTFINSGSISRVRMWNYEAGSGGDLFFNNLRVGPATATYLYEDTAAAYSSWSGNLGQGPLANGGRISGADTDTLTITNLEGSDAGYYDVVVWNSCGAGVSDANRGQLTVAVPNYGIRDDAGVNLPTLTYWYTGQGSDITEQGTDFNSRNFGTVQAVWLKGSAIKTWKTGSGDVSGTKIEYKVWKTTDSEPGSWTERSVGWSSDDGSGNQTWADFGSDIEITSGLDQNHSYNFKIRFTVQGSGTPGINEVGPFTATFAFAPPTAPDDPASTSATADGPQMVRLAWTKNGAGHNVLILHKNSPITTDPTGGVGYTVGQTIDGATVIYNGSATSREHVVAAGSANYYAFYSVNANYYSDGVHENLNMTTYGGGRIDQFAYTNATTLAGGNTGKDWSGSWSIGSGTWTIEPNSSPTFPDVDGYADSAANRVRMSNPGDNTSSTATRSFSTISSGSIYVAFMMAYQYEGENKWAGLSFSDGGTERAFFGKGYGGDWYTFAIGDGSSTFFSGKAMRGRHHDADSIYLVVGKYDIGSGSIRANLYSASDTLPASEPGSGDWDANATGLSLGAVNAIRIGGGAGDGFGSIGEAWFDEIRVATTWSDLIASVCPTWVGNHERWPSGDVYLGDAVHFKVESYPIGPGQSAVVNIDWEDSSSSSYGMYFWKFESNNTFWTNLVQMSKVGTHDWSMTVAATGCDQDSNTSGITVLALPNPSAQQAVVDGVFSNSQINLSWTKNGIGHDVMVVRRTSNTDWPTPSPGVTYFASDTFGDATVVYRGSATSFNDTGLAPNTTYYYRYYSENWGYYSTGVDANATTGEGEQEIVVDGNPNDWVGAPGTVINSSAFSANEFIWRDRPSDARTDDANYANAEIKEFRVYADDDDVYFLVKYDNVTDDAHPYIAIGVDTRRSTESSAMNWIGDDANTFVGNEYFGDGAAWRFPEINIIVHKVGSDVRVELFHHTGGSWYGPSTYSAAISATHNALEVRIPRGDLNLTGTTTARFTVASFLNTGVWANEGNSTVNMPQGTPDAVDSVSIAPYLVNDGSLSMSAWAEALSDSDVDFWFDVRFASAGLAGNTPPTAPGSLSPTHDANVAASPVLSWAASSDSDGDVTSYFLEVSTSPTLNGVDGTENGQILLRLNLPATQTSYHLSTSETQYFWRVRARDTAGALSGGTINRFTIGGQTDVQGPLPTLLYIGSDVAGYLNGDYNALIEQFGHIQDVLDSEIAAGDTFGFVLRWEDSSGVYATNKTHEGAAEGAGQFAWNIVSDNGRVSPNWDIIEYRYDEEGAFLGTYEWGIDVAFPASNTWATGNSDPAITNWVVAAFSITNYNPLTEYYLTVSAEDAHTAGGSWWEYGTWASFGAPGGKYWGGYAADGPNTARNITTNYLIRIQVRDDDSEPPLVGSGLASWGDRPMIASNTTAGLLDQVGAGQATIHRISDAELAANNDLTLLFNVWDRYMGLQRGTSGTTTDGGNVLTNTRVTIDGWVTNNTAAYRADLSDANTTHEDSYSAWLFNPLYEDLGMLWGPEVHAPVSSTNRVVLHLFDSDNDRPEDQADQLVTMGFIQLYDDDTEPPLVHEFTVEGQGLTDEGRLPAGGIAIVGVNGHTVTGDGPGGGENFSFVVLSPFPEGTRLWFTDAGWSNYTDMGWSRTSEFHVAYWDSTGSEAVGDVISLVISNLNNGGDQVAVYQYDGETNPREDPENVRFIYALNMGSEWLDLYVAQGNEYSALYTGLTNFVNAVDLPAGGASRANWTYVGPRSGTASDLLLTISMRENWAHTAGATDMNLADIFEGGFTILGPGDLAWDAPILTDAQINQGGYSITGVVQDITAGLQVTGTSWAPPPHFVLVNADGDMVTSNHFTAGFASGVTDERTLMHEAGTGTYDRIVLGEHELQLVISDADNNRPFDSLVTTNVLQILVVDDDPYPPRIGPARLQITMGAEPLAPVPSGDAELLGYWHFNDSDYARNAGFTGAMTTSGLNGTISWFGGSTINLYDTNTLGVAFSPNAAGNIGGSFQFELDMSAHMALVMTFAGQRTTQGYDANQVSYSLDGVTFTPFGSPFDLPTSFALQTFDFSSVPELNGQPQVFIRITLGVDTASGSGNNRYDNIQFNAYPLEDLVFEVTDAQLAAISGANPLEFGFNVYDPISGVARGEDGVDMVVSIDGLFDEDSSFDGGLSSADTVDPDSMTVWAYDSEIPYEDRGVLYGDGTQLRPIMATFADMDDNRPGDRSWYSNAVFAALRIIDDDEEPPAYSTHRFGGTGATPLRALQVTTNAGTPQVLTSAQDPWVRGARLSTASGNNADTGTVFVLTDAEMENPVAAGIRFAIGALDVHSGVSRGNAGGSNTVMSVSMGDYIQGNYGDFDAGMSTDGNPTNAVLTNVWTLTRTWTDEQLTAMVEGGNMAVTVTIPDLDDDRPNDRATIYSRRVGFIDVVDDDVYPPLMSAVELDISSVHNLFVMGFETYHGWTNAQNFSYVSWQTDIADDRWLGNDINLIPLAGDLPSQVRVIGMRNQDAESAWLQMPPREDPGTLFVWARLSVAGNREIILEGRQDPDDPWTDLGVRNVTNANWELLNWPVNETGEWTLRLRRTTGGGTPTLYLDDIILTKNIAWTNVNDMELTFPQAEDQSGVYQYRAVQDVSAPLWQGGTNVLEGDLLSVTGVEVKQATLPLEEGMITGFVFAVDNDNNRPGDRLRNPGVPYVVRVDRTPPLPATTLRATDAAGGNVFDPTIDDTSEIKIEWTPPGGFGGSEAIAAGRRADGVELSPWDSYVITYHEVNDGEGDISPSGSITNVITRSTEGWSNVLHTHTFTNLVLADLAFDTYYRVTIQGRDKAGNLGPAASVVGNTDRFIVTQGLARTSSRSEIFWTVATDQEGHVTREYDLISADSSGYGDHMQQQFRWQPVGTVYSNWYFDEVPIDGNNMRFFRATPAGRWQGVRPIASEEVYIAKPIHLRRPEGRRGQNWVSFPGIPDTSTVVRVFGTDLPATTGGFTDGTVLTWYDRVAGTVATQQIYLAQGQNGNQWLYRLPENMDGLVADQAIVPLDQAVVVNLPSNASLTNYTVLFVGRVPTNTMTQAVAGNGANNLVSFRLPRHMHPNEMNLLESGFTGNTNPNRSDWIVKYDRADQKPSTTVYFNTSPDPNLGGWRFFGTSYPGSPVPAGFFGPDDGLLIVTRGSTSNWQWTMPLPYDPPTRFLDP